MKLISILLLISFLSFNIVPCNALTDEAAVVLPQPHNFWQEADIIFFQTLPFAAFWGHFFDQQLSAQLAYAGAPHWNAIVGFAVIVSAVNAKLYADKVSVDIAK